MPIDTSMYANIQNPQQQGLQSLGSMIGIANAVQQNQALRNANVQSGIDAQEMQAVRPILANSQAYTDQNGNVDFNKLVPAVMSVAPKNGSGIIAQLSQAQQQKIATQNALMSQSMDSLQRASNAIATIDPNNVTSQDLALTAKAINSNFDNPQAVAANNRLFAMAQKVLANTSPGDPARQQGLARMAMMYRPIPEQQAINTPNPAQISTGQQSALINLKPGVSGAPQYGILPGSQQRVELPPSAPVIGPNNTPGYFGAQGPAGSLSPQTQAPQQQGQQAPIAGKQGGFIASGLPAGAAQNIESNVQEMNRHFASLQDTSAGNQLVQSLKGNINSLAQKAITGTEGDKLAYVNGLLAALPGHGHSDNLKTATDLLDKQLAQLNLTTPASSDAARALVTVARPHASMSSDAIQEATNQVASQVEANMAIRNHLSGYKYGNNGQGNPAAYQAERQNIEQAADPRIWQYQDLGPGTPAAKKFIQGLQPADRQNLIKKAQVLQRMGVIQ